MGIIKKGYTFSDKNEDWESHKATAIRLNKLIDDATWNGVTNSDGYAPDDGITPNDPTGLSYTSGVETIILSWSWVQNTQALKTWIYESTTNSIPASPSFYVGQDQRTFFRNNLPAGSVRYYWIKVEARNGRFSNVVGPLAATVVSWPVTDTITSNLGKKVVRSATTPTGANEGDLWINTSDNNDLYRYESGTWVRYRDTRVDSIAKEYVLMVSPTAAGPSNRITGFRATNMDGGKNIQTATRSGNVVTITTTTAHGYSSTNLISITGLGWTTVNPNGGYNVTVTSTTQFTYILASGSGSETYTVTGAYAAKGTEFVVQTDYFSVIDSSGTIQESPFTITGTPAKVYIKDAVIQNVAASKLTAGTITSQAITISDGVTPGSGTIQSSGFSAGSSGWRIRGTGDAEFNSVTVRNGTIASPTVNNATFTDAIIITSAIGMRRAANNAVLTITGASNNGSSNGAQIDLCGNDFGGAGAGGYLIFQAGQGAQSEIRMLTDVSTTSNVGVERLKIDKNGLVAVNRDFSTGGVFTQDAGNLLVDSNIAVGPLTPINTNTSIGNITASNTISGNKIQATGNGTAAAPAFTFTDTDSGLFYDSADKIALAVGGSAKLFVSTNFVTIGNVLKLNSSGGTTPTGVVDGCIWYDGTDFKAQTGGVVKTINLI